jgi:hypothetical protein
MTRNKLRKLSEVENALPLVDLVHQCIQYSNADKILKDAKLDENLVITQD